MIRKSLSYRVLVLDPIPFADTEKTPEGDARMFQPIAVTLITGETDGVRVDRPMTAEQAEAVGKWVENSGKRLKAIVSTHGHGDHWFGTAMLLKRFPDAKAYATAGTIEVMRFHANPEFRAASWDKSFPRQIPDSPVVSTPAPDNVFKLDGNEVRFVEVGHSDTDKSSVIHVPSIGLVVAGDVVYNGYHQYLAESGNGGLKAWMRALDTVANLKPTHVVASHKNKDLPDDPKAIEATRWLCRQSGLSRHESCGACLLRVCKLERRKALLRCPCPVGGWRTRPELTRPGHRDEALRQLDIRHGDHQRQHRHRPREPWRS